MSSYDLVKNIIKAQNADLIRRISDRFGLDHDEMRAKYLRPTFYVPDVDNTPTQVFFTDKGTKYIRNTTEGDSPQNQR